jgi:4-amino-4-deoxy-L-arabinose transferase-like glycosyltransferase
VHTVLASSGHRRRHVKGAGWLYALIFLVGGITWAWIEAPTWVRILLVVIAFAVIVLAALALLGTVIQRREARERAKAGDAGWRAQHVPASAEYKAAHPEGPRDWEAGR